MPQEVRLRKDLGVIEILPFGEISPTDLQDSLQEVRKLHEQHGVVSVLVDAGDPRSSPDTVGLFGFTKDLPRGFKFAVVQSEQPTLHDAQSFIETVAQNRGVSLRLFPSREEALHWLD